MRNWKATVACVAVAAAWLVIALAPAAQTGGDAKDKKPAKDKSAKGAAAKAGPAKEPAKKPATHKVEKKPFRVELALKGVLEPAETVAIAHRPEPLINVPFTSGPMTIRTIVEHGSSVRQGEILVALDTRKLDQVMEQMKTDLQGSLASLQIAEREQPLAERAAPLEMETAERTKREADEDLAYYFKTGRPQAEQRAHQLVRYASFYYDFAKEQLRQLEKMYKANDLTEDTEQMILKRQKFFTDEAKLELQDAEISRDLMLKTVLPRKDKLLKDNVTRQTLLLAKARETHSLALAQKRQQLAKMKFDAERLRNTLEMLARERDAMMIKSPADGVAYYGKFSHGQWEASTALAARLSPGGTISDHEVFMTIVKPGPVVVRLLIDEKDAGLVKPGLAGKAETTFNPDAKLSAKIEKISVIPAAPGKFEAVAAVNAGQGSLPGMACTVKLVPYVKKDAIAVPAGAVFEDDDIHFVHVVKPQGKDEKREVRPGRTSKGNTEILSGLSAGEEILLERPDQKKTPPAAPAKGKDKIKEDEK
ncbi:MAG: HlyD family efflux transporter periplasmic adaptor subunit [Gemmataceae bacterium]|nr:HlyD family efflux transporter periplasmic adaptor subunit [Gemmataceae bacterium]